MKPWIAAESGASCGVMGVEPEIRATARHQPSRATRRVIMIAGRDPKDEPGGGHSSYVRAHARAAIRAGYEPHLFCIGNGKGEEEYSYGVVHRAPPNRHAVRQSEIRHHALPLARSILSRAELLSGATAIHGFGVWTYAATLIAADFPTSLRRVMSMYTVYEVERHAQYLALGRRRLTPQGVTERARWRSVRREVTALEGDAIAWSDVVVVNYASLRDLVVQVHPIAAPKISIAPYGPESAFLEDPDPRIGGVFGHRPAILSIALQRPKKGGEVLLEALRILRDRGQDFRAAMVGGGEMLPRLRRLARRFGLDDFVEFPGIVPDVRPWLAACDLYVQPSIREESGSMALLEAMQFGRPVICSAVDGMIEDVRDGIDGVLVPPSDPIALANAIGDLLDDPERRRRIGSAARARFEATFDADRFAASLAQLYEGAPPPTPPPPPRTRR
jgi:glycosyltransferase involved in cell wall biosynthesis